jgi:hypothetical protein
VLSTVRQEISDAGGADLTSAWLAIVADVGILEQGRHAHRALLGLGGRGTALLLLLPGRRGTTLLLSATLRSAAGGARRLVRAGLGRAR